MRLRQSIAQTPAHDADVFAMAVWVGTIGGAALGTDPNPNTTPPAANRILTCNPRKTLLAHGAAILRAVAAPIAASTITYQWWFFDATMNLWIQYGAPLTIVPTGGAAINVNGVNIGNFAGAQIFLQITANTNVQAIGYDYQ